jgi:uncharacterized protein (TIGR03437 family)
MFTADVKEWAFLDGRGKAKVRSAALTPRTRRRTLLANLQPARSLMRMFCALLGLMAAAAAAQAPAISSGGIVNAASFRNVNFGVARGAIISIFGSNLATGTVSVDRLPVPTQLPGSTTQVMFGTIAAPLFFVSPLQINAQVPFEIPATTSSVNVVVRNGGVSSAPVNVSVISGDPGVFSISQTGLGPGAILHGDGSLVTPANPVKPSEVLVIFCTGLGAVNPTVASGAGAPAAEPLARVSTVPAVTLAGRAAAVEFAGLAPGFVGLYQVNVRVPPDFTEPTPNVVLTQSARTAPTVSAGASGLISVTPVTMATGADTVALSATGVNLTANASINFGGRRLTSTVTPAGATQTITATVPGAAVRVPGTIPVYVTSPETGTTQSNSINFTVTGTRIAGTAPAISAVTIAGPSGSISGVLGSVVTYTVNLTFEDPDGDIVYNGTLNNSARVEVQLTGGCTFQVTGPTLNYPDQTMATLRFQATFVARILIASGLEGISLPVNVRLLDQASNGSNRVEALLASSFFVCP